MVDLKTYKCENPPSEFEQLNSDEKRILLDWCDSLGMIKSFNRKHTSYGIKHIFERSKNGFYVTNGQFKGAMLKAGFNVLDPSKLNWMFNVSEKSIKQAIKENESNRKY